MSPCLHRGDALVERASGESVVNISKAHQGPGKDCEYEGIDSRPAGGNHPGDVAVWNKCIQQNRVIAAGRAHAQNVPCLLDCVSRSIARHERVDDFRLVRVAGIHSVQTEPGPYRRQTAEMLVPGEPVAALDALGCRGGEQNRDIVAALRVAGSEDLARRCLTQDPLE